MALRVKLLVLVLCGWLVSFVGSSYVLACRPPGCVGGCMSPIDPDWGVLPYLISDDLLGGETGEDCPCPPPEPEAVTLSNGALSCPGTEAEEPIRYLDGGAVYSTPPLSFPTPAGPASFYLSYNNRPLDAGAVVDEGFGPGWALNIPHLEFRAQNGDPQGRALLVLDGRYSYEFAKAGLGIWTGLHGVQGVITGRHKQPVYS